MSACTSTNVDFSGLIQYIQSYDVDGQSSLLNIIQRIAKLALRLPELIGGTLPLLRPGIESSLYMTQLQVNFFIFISFLFNLFSLSFFKNIVSIYY